MIPPRGGENSGCDSRCEESPAHVIRVRRFRVREAEDSTGPAALDLMYPGSNRKASLKLLETKFAPTSDRDQSHAVHNYDELISHLEGTRFASQLRGTAANGSKIGDN